MPQVQYGWFFRITCRLLKYFCFGLYGFATACFLGIILGAYPIVVGLFIDIIPLLARGAVGLLMLLLTAILWESTR